MTELIAGLEPHYCHGKEPFPRRTWRVKLDYSAYERPNAAFRSFRVPRRYLSKFMDTSTHGTPTAGESRHFPHIFNVEHSLAFQLAILEEEEQEQEQEQKQVQIVIYDS